MSYLIEIRCPTCDVIAYSFEVMMSHFGLNTRKMKPYPQCKECHSKGLNFARRDRYVRIETACDSATCDTKVSGIRSMSEDFGVKPYVTGGAAYQEPHDLCRMCRGVGNPNAREEDTIEGIYIDEYITKRGGLARSFVVIGPTSPHADLLKDVGGRWVKKLSDREGFGWVFPMRKKQVVISILQRRRNVFEDKEENDEDEDPLPEGACPDCRGETEDRGTYLVCVECNKLTMK